MAGRASRSKGGLPPTLGEVLGEGVRAGIDRPLESGRLWAAWSEIVGPDIAAHAEPTSLRKGVLRVRTDSAAWATEVGYLGGEIARRANALLAAKVVSEVRTWTGSRREPARRSTQTTRKQTAGAVSREPTRARTTDPLEAVARARAAWAAARSRKAAKGPSTSP